MPVRTCVVCRKKVEKEHLFRFVIARERSGYIEATNEVVLDALQLYTGRGTYCHPSRECLGNRKFVSLLSRSLLLQKGRTKTSKGHKSGPSLPSIDKPNALLSRALLSECLRTLQESGSGTLKCKSAIEKLVEVSGDLGVSIHE